MVIVRKLMKRTPLKSRSQLRSSSVLRSSPLRKRSAKTTAIYKARRPLVERLLTERPVCEFPGCSRGSVDVHEVLSRGRGGSILDEGNLRCLCRECHIWVTDHPREAEEIGLLEKSLK